jgi:hypothetical protein
MGGDALKKRLSALVFLSVLLLAGCLGDPVQDEILTYVNEDTADAKELEGKAISAYESVSGENYSDDQTMYDALLNDVIPTYTEFIKELESVSIEEEELKEIHEIYIEGANLQLQGFNKIVEALEAQDASIIDEANEILADGRNSIQDYQAKLEEFAKEHDVEITK